MRYLFALLSFAAVCGSAAAGVTPQELDAALTAGNPVTDDYGDRSPLKASQTAGCKTTLTLASGRKIVFDWKTDSYEPEGSTALSLYFGKSGIDLLFGNAQAANTALFMLDQMHDNCSK